MLFWIFVIAVGVFLGGLALRYWYVVLALLWFGFLFLVSLLGVLLLYGWAVQRS